MKIKDLFKDVDYQLLMGSIDFEVQDLTYNSHTANANNCFIALVGIDTDGHNFLEEVLANGCQCLIVCQEVHFKKDNLTIIKVQDTRKILPIISANLFNHPDKHLIKIGITGTKGKTTVSYMIKHILEDSGKKVGLIGTNGTFFLDQQISHKNTTPESYLIAKYMRLMVDNGIEYLVMEVSSQALKVGRVSNIIFDYAIFTNLSYDHIGPREHATYYEYVSSKAKLFNQTKIGIINKDDPEFNQIIAQATAKIITYGQTDADYQISSISKKKTNNFLGMSFKLNNQKYIVNMPGEFSVYNATGAIILTQLLNIYPSIIYQSLQNIHIDGRMEIIPVKDQYHVVIDYAHNNLSIASVIHTMRSYAKNIVTVIGCGGGRSRDIRRGIGKTVGTLSNLTIITADNPRNDNLDEINQDLKEGVLSVGGKCLIIPDRKEAIIYAMNKVKKKDVVLLLGKGHEKYEEVKGHRKYFSEKLIVNKVIRGDNR